MIICRLGTMKQILWCGMKGLNIYASIHSRLACRWLVLGRNPYACWEDGVDIIAADTVESMYSMYSMHEPSSGDHSIPCISLFPHHRDVTLHTTYDVGGGHLLVSHGLPPLARSQDAIHADRDT